MGKIEIGRINSRAGPLVCASSPRNGVAGTRVAESAEKEASKREETKRREFQIGIMRKYILTNSEGSLLQPLLP